MISPASSKVTIATIASSASLSGVLNVWLSNVVGIVMPSAWTAAVLTFQASMDGVNFFDLYNDSGVEYEIPALVSQAIVLSAPLTFPYLKVRSGTTGSPVTQGAARTVSLICS